MFIRLATAQCDQIGLFCEGLTTTKLLENEAQLFDNVLGYFEKVTFRQKRDRTAGKERFAFTNG